MLVKMGHPWRRKPHIGLGSQYGTKPYRTKLKGWSAVEKAFLTDHYATCSTRWIAGQLKRTPTAVVDMAYRLRYHRVHFPFKEPSSMLKKRGRAFSSWKKANGYK